jgi:Phospholipase_D-nuclease N-terminal
MSLWDVMVSIFWFMLLVAWFWLLMSIISDVFRDDDLSGVAKAAWCIFVILLPWVGVLTYLIARGRSMGERASREAARNEQAFRSYVRDVAVSERSSSLSGELSQLAEMRDRGQLTPVQYEQAKQRVLGTADSAPAGPSQRTPVADSLPA